MRVAVPKEIAPGETRVALTPDVVRRLDDESYEFVVQAGAGASAGFDDEEFREQGVRLVADAAEVYSGADVVLKVRAPQRRDGADEVELLEPGTVVAGFLAPRTNRRLLERLAEREVTAMALELVPRISRAQSMDALSSQATVAGYKAAVLAANSVTKFFPMLTTAAGTVKPARVLVLGAGVAGLQAIATCRRLGARVEAFDIRPEVKEQVESLGAEFLELEEELDESGEGEGGYAKELSKEKEERERELIAEHAAGADAVITTALVPGRPAPTLVAASTVDRMRPGSTVVDLAGEAGGNCEVSQPGESVERGGVVVHAPLNLPASLPHHASQMYSRNLSSFLKLLAPGGELILDLDDEILDACCVTHEGGIRFQE